MQRVPLILCCVVACALAVQCPDGSSCSDGSASCLLSASGSGYVCCPNSYGYQAVTCGNNFCCVAKYCSDKSTGTCMIPYRVLPCNNSIGIDEQCSQSGANTCCQHNDKCVLTSSMKQYCQQLSNGFPTASATPLPPFYSSSAYTTLPLFTTSPTQTRRTTRPPTTTTTRKTTTTRTTTTTTPTTRRQQTPTAATPPADDCPARCATCCWFTGVAGCCPYGENSICCADLQSCCPANSKCMNNGLCGNAFGLFRAATKPDEKIL